MDSKISSLWTGVAEGVKSLVSFIPTIVHSKKFYEKQTFLAIISKAYPNYAGLPDCQSTAFVSRNNQILIST